MLVSHKLLNHFRRAFSSYPSPTTNAPQGRKKVTLNTIRKLYNEKTPISVLTAHDYPSGRLLDSSGVDICLVGDSLAMVCLGYENTNQITFDEMLHHARAVARGAKSPFLVGDLPFGTYETNSDDAVRNSIRYIREGNVEAVKLEGGAELAATVSRITTVGIPVMGHVGLLPQRQASLGGFRVQGKSIDSAKRILEDALALQDAGCFSIVLEAIPEVVATFITSQLSIPTIGIGAGPGTSGQVLVQLDALGAYDKLAPKFCKVYAHTADSSLEGLQQYVREVRESAFPVSGQHTYKMDPAQEQLFKEWVIASDMKSSSNV